MKLNDFPVIVTRTSTGHYIVQHALHSGWPNKRMPPASFATLPELLVWFTEFYQAAPADTPSKI